MSTYTINECLKLTLFKYLVQLSSGYNFAVLPLVQWGDLSAKMVDDMVYYINQSAQGDESTISKEIPGSLIFTRIKRHYCAQRQQKQTASSPTRRRRGRLQNRKSHLKMVRCFKLNRTLCALAEERNGLLASAIQLRGKFCFESHGFS